MDSTTFKTLEQLEKGTPTDKVIRLKSVYKTGKTTVQPVTDGHGWYKGVPRLSDDDKKSLIHWAEPETKFTLKDGTTFDLNDEVQSVTWEWVKHCPCIAETYEECQFTPGAEFYVYLENKEAEKNVSRKELKVRALMLIMEDNAVNYSLRSKLLGVNMDGEKPVVIKEFLMDEAEKNPVKVAAIYESHDVSLRILLMKAKEKQIITIDSSGIYRYGNNVLGMTETSAIGWLQDRGNKHLVEVLEKEVDPEYFVKEKTEDKPSGDTKETVYPINKGKKAGAKNTTEGVDSTSAGSDK